MSTFKSKVASGFAYSFAERVGAKGIGFIISLILARILLPTQYGIISLVTIVVSLLDVFVTYGFGSSLIADKNSDDVDFSTCFYFGIVLSIVIYALLFVFSPYIVEWLVSGKGGETKYDTDLLIRVLRIMSLRIPIAAINTVQHAYVSKHLMFKKFFYATLIGTIISGVVAVIMAYRGMGVWALVEQYLGNVCIDTICLSFIVKWRPSFSFSWMSLKKIYNYGWKVLVVGLIDVGYGQLRNLFIAKNYSAEDLAYYDKGNQFPATGIGFIEPTISSVMFPALSHCNDNQEEMRNITRRVIKISSYIIFPMMVGIAVVADPLIDFLLTSKWAQAAVYLQIGCAALIFRPVQIINNCVVRASGRSGLLLALDIVKKAIGIVLLILSIPFGVKGIAISLVLTNLISTVINIAPNRTILAYGYRDQLVDILGSLIIAVLMGSAVWAVNLLSINSAIKLCIQIIIGVIMYFLLSMITKNESFLYLINILKNRRRHA